jgi:hypothetical protein
MNTITGIISPAMQVLAPEGAKLPKHLWTGFGILHKVHALWGSYRWYQLAKNPDDWTTILICSGVNEVVEYFFVTKVAVRLIYFCKIVQDLSRQHMHVYKRYCMLKVSVKGVHGPYIFLSESKKKRSSLDVLILRIKQIVWAIFDFIKELYALSMRYMDAYQLLSFKSSGGARALSELVIERENYIEHLTKNRALLLEELENRKEMINDILKRWGAKSDADVWINRIRVVTGVGEGLTVGLRAFGFAVKEVTNTVTHSFFSSKGIFDALAEMLLNKNALLLKRMRKAVIEQKGPVRKEKCFPMLVVKG